MCFMNRRLFKNAELIELKLSSIPLYLKLKLSYDLMKTKFIYKWSNLLEKGTGMNLQIIIGNKLLWWED